jgi:tRNA (guanine37-N1)-methyltransferase
MLIDILTLFPEMFVGPFDESIIRRATDKSLVEIKVHNLRDYATDKHHTVDDRPFSGGPGMVLRVDIIDRAINAIKSEARNSKSETKVILLDAGGEKYTQQKAQALSSIEHLILICGHYEGVDHRVHEHLVDEIISIGDYVLTGGELPAMVLTDSVVRLLPGVLGDDQSTVEESHSIPGYLEYPQYTRPEEYNGWKVPKILLSGDHKKIKDWQSKKAV